MYSVSPTSLQLAHFTEEVLLLFLKCDFPEITDEIKYAVIVVMALIMDLVVAIVVCGLLSWGIDKSNCVTFWEISLFNFLPEELNKSCLLYEN